MNVTHDAFFQNYINGFAPPNRTSPPEWLAQIQINFTELFLIKPSTKIAPLNKGLSEIQIKLLLNGVFSWTTGPNLK